eukprot:TRINITY_DN2087_c0_g1_i1.p1 TRINITY_DN2087_c0_g1~~TRINITY_DN2087_c0_g1_i1.p1  ORF type:complete len:290 (+),score=80.85 TRINITY_DN2087_c0_g1_i1:145-1014(+)
MAPGAGKAYTVGVFGAEGVGKSCLILSMLQGDYPEEHDPTLEDAFRSHLTVDGVEYTLDITDTAGREEYAAGTHERVLDRAQMYMLVFSVTDRSSLACLDALYQQMKERHSGRKWKLPLVVVANKVDSANRVVQREEGVALAKRFDDACYLEAAASDRASTTAAFTELVRIKAQASGLDDGVTRGYLIKDAGGGLMGSLKSKNTRFFKLVGCNLYYYSNEKEEAAGAAALGELDLSGAVFIPAAEKLVFNLQGPSLNKVKKDKAYVLQAPDEAEFAMWQRAITDAAKLS